jgi:hypothetical protein
LLSLVVFWSEVPIFIFSVSYYSLERIFVGSKEPDGQSVLYMKSDFLVRLSIYYWTLEDLITKYSVLLHQSLLEIS